MSPIRTRALWSFIVAVVGGIAALFLIRLLVPSHFATAGSGALGLIFAAFAGYNVARFAFTEKQRLLRLAILLNPVCGLAAAGISLILWNYAVFFWPLLFIVVAVIALLVSVGLLIAHLQTSAHSAGTGAQ